MAWLGLALFALAAAAVLFWLLVLTEGTYLGPRVVTFLYDRFAGRYDRIKQFDEADEVFFLGRPLAEFADHQPGEMLVLDVASGTGRLPLAAWRALPDRFRFVALDRSLPMLQQAQAKLASLPSGTVVFVRHDATTLPFTSDLFDAVACLEALEFTPDPAAVLSELLRVLRPGGLLMVSNRIGWQARLMPGKTFDRRQFQDLLAQLGAAAVSSQPWQVEYDLVLAGKARQSGPVAVETPAWLRCPHCEESRLVEVASPVEGWRCPACRWQIELRRGIWQ